jgi:hypothetical protein
MQNKKVYLAKSNLASGLDYEYVKSSLLRIPDIEIIEYGDGIEPSECVCFVYVPQSTFTLYDNDGTHVFVNKNVFMDIIDYTDDEDKTNPLDTIFIYLGKSTNVSVNDVEQTSPCILRVVDYDLVTLESWDSFGVISYDKSEADSLLKFVNHCVGNSYDDWLKNTRHYIPEKKYAMPPIPSLNERRSKGTTRIQTNSTEVDSPKQFKEPDQIYQSFNSEDLISGKKPRRRR